MSWRIYLVGLVVVVISSCTPEIESRDPDVRMKAVTRVSDQTMLAKLAQEDSNEMVRVAAIALLSDQKLLAAIANDSKSSSQIRYAARMALRDEELITVTVLNDPYGNTNQELIRRLTSPALLARLAMDNKSHCENALLRLSELRAVAPDLDATALSAENSAVGANKHETQSILHLVSAASSSIPAVPPTAIAVSTPYHTSRACDFVPVISLLNDPSVVDRYGEIVSIKMEWEKQEAEYSTQKIVGPVEWAMVQGEKIDCKIVFSKGLTLDSNWSTRFPKSIGNGSRFVPAEIPEEDLIKKVMIKTPVPDLAYSGVKHRNPFVRDLVARITPDQLLLSRIASQDQDDWVRRRASERIAKSGR